MSGRINWPRRTEVGQAFSNCPRGYNKLPRKLSFLGAGAVSSKVYNSIQMESRTSKVQNLRLWTHLNPHA